MTLSAVQEERMRAVSQSQKGLFYVRDAGQFDHIRGKIGQMHPSHTDAHDFRLRCVCSGTVRYPQSNASSWRYSLSNVNAVTALANSYPR